MTPHSDEHYAFIKDLMYEKYDETLRRKMYDFYKSNDMNVWLPGQLNGTTLQYIVEFESGYHMVYLSGSAPYFWRIKN